MSETAKVIWGVCGLILFITGSGIVWGIGGTMLAIGGLILHDLTVSASANAIKEEIKNQRRDF